MMAEVRNTVHGKISLIHCEKISVNESIVAKE